MTKNHNLSASFFLLILLIISACEGSTKNSSQESSKGKDSEIRLKQYMVQGKQLFQTYCMNCHQSDGKGLAQLYPPLAGADYLLSDLPRAACMIKNGGTSEIEVNDIKYNQMMPGVPTLTPLEIAEVLTYITNEWENKKGLSSVKVVEKWLTDCK